MTRKIKANTPFTTTSDIIGLSCAAPASLQISVDGENWQVKDDLKDNINVIANIPQYLYLRCSTDCVITEA